MERENRGRWRDSGRAREREMNEGDKTEGGRKAK